MNRFVHVGFSFPGPPKMRDLEPVFTQLSQDWLRYSSTNWILWTDKSLEEIMAGVNPHLDDPDQVFMVPFDLSTQVLGIISPWIWDWMRNKGSTIITGNTLKEIFDKSQQLPKS